MSLGGGYSSALNAAVDACVDAVGSNTVKTAANEQQFNKNKSAYNG